MFIIPTTALSSVFFFPYIYLLDPPFVTIRNGFPEDNLYPSAVCLSVCLSVCPCLQCFSFSPLIPIFVRYIRSFLRSHFFFSFYYFFFQLILLHFLPKNLSISAPSLQHCMVRPVRLCPASPLPPIYFIASCFAFLNWQFFFWFINIHPAVRRFRRERIRIFEYFWKFCFFFFFFFISIFCFL